MSVVFVLYTDALKPEAYADHWANYLTCLDITYTDKAVGGKFAMVENLPDFPGVIGYVTNFESSSVHTDEVYLVFDLKDMPVAEVSDLVQADDKRLSVEVFRHAIRVHMNEMFKGLSRVYYSKEDTPFITAVTKGGADYYRDLIAKCLRSGLKSV